MLLMDSMIRGKQHPILTQWPVMVGVNIPQRNSVNPAPDLSFCVEKKPSSLKTCWCLDETIHLNSITF